MMDNYQFGSAGYKGSAFNTPDDKSQWTRHPVASSLVTRADKRRGTAALRETLKAENLEPSEVSHLVAHERKHLKVVTGPVELGVYRDELGRIAGCYVHRLNAPGTAEETMELAAAADALFTREGEGDTATWLGALRRSVEG